MRLPRKLLNSKALIFFVRTGKNAGEKGSSEDPQCGRAGGSKSGQAGIAKQNMDAQVSVCWILHLGDRVSLGGG